MTLIEILLVIGILLVLAAIIFTATGPAKKGGQVARCTAHLRQIGMAIQMYQEQHGHYPDPRDLTLGTALPDKRLLFCPEDTTVATLGAASSYRFRHTVPPDFALLADRVDLDPNVVLVGCAHHLGQREVVLERDNTRLTPPVYPFHLVLRASGQVERLPLSRVRQFFQAEDRPVLRTLYPGEPGYEAARPSPAAGRAMAPVTPRQEPQRSRRGRGAPPERLKEQEETP